MNKHRTVLVIKSAVSVTLIISVIGLNSYRLEIFAGFKGISFNLGYVFTDCIRCSSGRGGEFNENGLGFIIENAAGVARVIRVRGVNRYALKRGAKVKYMIVICFGNETYAYNRRGDCNTG